MKTALIASKTNSAPGSCGMVLRMVNHGPTVQLAISKMKVDAHLSNIGVLLMLTTGEKPVLDSLLTPNKIVLQSVLSTFPSALPLLS